MFSGEASEPGEGSHHSVLYQIEASPDLELFDVLGEVARGHTLVDVLVASQDAELLDASLHVVADDLLALLE
jgi:hypothetical protein